MDGCDIHFAPPKKPWLKPLFGLYLQGNRLITGLLRWCRMDFVHPLDVQTFRILHGRCHAGSLNWIKAVPDFDAHPQKDWVFQPFYPVPLLK